MAKDSPAKWVRLLELGDVVEAEVIVSMLHGSGISARLVQESVGKLYGFATGPIGGITIEVLREDLEVAEQLLEVTELQDDADEGRDGDGGGE